MTEEHKDPVDDDDLWVDDEHERSGISALIVILLAVAVLGVVAILVATRKGDDEAGAKGDRTSTTDPSGGGQSASTTTPQKAEWNFTGKSRPPVFGQTGDPMDKVTKTVKPGAYLWVDFDGWHLWVADPAGRTSARGTIVSDKPFARAALARKGQGTVERDGGKITFDLRGVNSPLGGVDFNTGFYSKRVVVDLEGADLPLKLGSNLAESSDPAVIDRAVPD